MISKKIVTASCGRCGSTLISKAIANHFGMEWSDFVRGYHELPEFGILKTHCWAPKELEPNGRYLYIYGDPVTSAISAHSQPEDFQIAHYINMGASYETKKFWPYEDVLHLEQNFRSWQRHFGRSNVMPISYEEMFDDKKRSQICEFIGEQVVFPPRVSRQTSIDPGNPTHAAAIKTYSGLFA